jgi:hypothetical protein
MRSKRGQLYDTNKDPKEQHNIADRHKEATVGLDRMLHHVDSEIDASLHAPGASDEGNQTGVKFTDKEEHRLRALGYLQ